MKKIINIVPILAILLVAATSCEHEDHPGKQNRAEIKFGTASTRAEVNAAGDILEFGVCADMNLGADDTPEAMEWIPLFENDRVWRNNATSEFTYENERFWVDYRSYHFFGVHPYPASVARAIEDIMSGDEKTGTKISYTIPITIPYAADDDIMTAYKAQVTTDMSSHPSSVDMQFEHKLSRVKLNIKADESGHEYTITEIGLSGVSRTGSLVYELIPGSRKNEAVITNSENRNIRRRNLSVVLDTDGESILGDGGMLVMPQAVNVGQVKLEISYKYKQINDASGTVTNLTASVNIPAITWVSGNTYEYNLTLKMDDKLYISTPTVAPWGSPQSGGIIIIK